MRGGWHEKRSSRTRTYGTNSKSDLVKLKERLIFIEWNNSGKEDDISTYSKSFEGGKSIEMTRIRLKNYEVLYQALLENKAKYNAPMLRRLKQDIYELVLTNKPTGRIRTIGLEDEKLEDVEVVVGVGVMSEFGQKGYTAITAAELYTDVVLDNGNYDPDKIVHLTLPMLLSSNSNSMPVNKYIANCTEEVPEKVSNAIKANYDDLLSGTIKKSRESCQYRNYTINELRMNCPEDKCLQYIPYLRQENIVVDELHVLLKHVLQENPNILSER